MEIVAEAGSSFAFPSQTTYIDTGTGLNDERAWQAERQVHEWRERDELFLPAFPDTTIQALRNTLEYPPKGSPRSGTGHSSAGHLSV